ncbi:hypothetical protein TNCV_4589591 [Trichonephila clavipes]|nr:hypothetical protein TNCV_4589591 [Trichonephila clavipes]
MLLKTSSTHFTNPTTTRLRDLGSSTEVQWITLKCSRKSTKLQCQEFKDYIKEIERLNTVKVPTATAASKTAKRKEKQASDLVAPTPGSVGKKKCSERSLPTQHPFPSCRRRKRFRWRKDISSDDSSGRKQK